MSTGYCEALSLGFWTVSNIQIKNFILKYSINFAIFSPNNCTFHNMDYQNFLLVKVIPFFLHNFLFCGILSFRIHILNFTGFCVFFFSVDLGNHWSLINNEIRWTLDRPHNARMAKAIYKLRGKQSLSIAVKVWQFCSEVVK